MLRTGVEPGEFPGEILTDRDCGTPGGFAPTPPSHVDRSRPRVLLFKLAPTADGGFPGSRGSLRSARKILRTVIPL